jgi:hypothetical protein
MRHPAVQVPHEKQAVISQAASWVITSRLKFGLSSDTRIGLPSIVKTLVELHPSSMFP